MGNKVENKYLANSFSNWLKEDYYVILGIKHNATKEEINKAFKSVVKTTNPHTYPKDSIMAKYAELKLKHLIQIRETLLDKDKREEYDFQRQLSQDCYIDFMISSSSLIDSSLPKSNSHLGNKVLNNYINKDMRIYNITKTEMNTLDELYNITNLFN